MHGVHLKCSYLLSSVNFQTFAPTLQRKAECVCVCGVCVCVCGVCVMCVYVRVHECVFPVSLSEYSGNWYPRSIDRGWKYPVKNQEGDENPPLKHWKFWTLCNRCICSLFTQFLCSCIIQKQFTENYIPHWICIALFQACSILTDTGWPHHTVTLLTSSWRRPHAVMCKVTWRTQTWTWSFSSSSPHPVRNPSIVCQTSVVRATRQRGSTFCAIRVPLSWRLRTTSAEVELPQHQVSACCLLLLLIEFKCIWSWFCGIANVQLHYELSGDLWRRPLLRGTTAADAEICVHSAENQNLSNVLSFNPRVDQNVEIISWGAVGGNPAPLPPYFDLLSWKSLHIEDKICVCLLTTACFGPMGLNSPVLLYELCVLVLGVGLLESTRLLLLLKILVKSIKCGMIIEMKDNSRVS